MILVLQDSVTSNTIGEITVDFVPNVGDTFIYDEGLPTETHYQITKRLVPTLLRDGEKVIRVRVHVVT